MRALANDEDMVDVDVVVAADGGGNIVNAQKADCFGNIAERMEVEEDVIEGLIGMFLRLLEFGAH